MRVIDNYDHSVDKWKVKFNRNMILVLEYLTENLYIYIYKRLKCSTTTSKKMLKYNKNNYRSTKRL